LTARDGPTYLDPVRLAILVGLLAAAATAQAEPVAERASRPCLRQAVEITHFRRPRERVRIALTRCDGSPNPDAVVPLSVLARAWRTPPPSDAAIAAYARAHPSRRGWLTARHRRLDPGLLTRLQALADRWPGRRFVIVSGYRPNANRGSRHRVGKALDLQIEGVERAEVARFARLLANTGVGYYPRSTFTHIDVRDRAAFWIDRSRPGQRADYGPWPGWELDPAGTARDAELDRAQVRQAVAAAVGASGGSERERRQDSAPDPEDEPRALLDLRELRRRARDVVEAMPPPRPVQVLAPGRRQVAPVYTRRDRLPTPPIDWSVPW